MKRTFASLLIYLALLARHCVAIRYHVPGAAYPSRRQSFLSRNDEPEGMPYPKTHGEVAVPIVELPRDGAQAEESVKGDVLKAEAESEDTEEEKKEASDLSEDADAAEKGELQGIHEAEEAASAGQDPALESEAHHSSEIRQEENSETAALQEEVAHEDAAISVSDKGIAPSESPDTEESDRNVEGAIQEAENAEGVAESDEVVQGAEQGQEEENPEKSPESNCSKKVKDLETAAKTLDQAEETAKDVEQETEIAHETEEAEKLEESAKELEGVTH